ncbi:MAG: glycerophosphodiester phosphodiesterase [Candidatus Micrarchaeia archaeon]
MVFLIIGHRGASGNAPENTLKSFAEAISDGANAVELDVRSTKDGRLVVFHNEKLDKLTGAKGYVKDFTLREIKGLSIDGEKIPTLEEALEFIHKNVGKKLEKVLIEIKEPGTESAIIDEIKKFGMEDVAIIISFHEDSLRKSKAIDSKIETGFIYASYKDPIGTAKSIGASYLLPLYRFTHSKDIERAHENNFKIIVWTVNGKAEMEEFKRKGVDGIATDYPSILSSLK